jgi:prepilin-type N-terminal cleavage/methylation domain-containing protein/prepilin-type processing-associated H-X9-DG protein
MCPKPAPLALSTRRACRRAAGFTLVELLVVIGIIAVLISILLPTLSGARRSANSVKCLASLKEIGNAFSMYAMENKGMYPAVRDKYFQFAPNGTTKVERRWTDQLSKYFNKQQMNMGVDDLTKIRVNSVLWGCPEWAKTFDYDPKFTNYGDKVYNGYGMQYYPSFPDRDYSDATNAYKADFAARKGYFKQSYWARKGSDRLLVADSDQDLVALPTTAALAKVATYTKYNGFTTDAVRFVPFISGTATTEDFRIDSRHMKPGTTKQGAMNLKSINALFADGHAQSVNVREAFNAIRNPGMETTK